jgi:hypothetical protein
MFNNNFKRISIRHKNNKSWYYIRNHARYAFPRYSKYGKLLEKKLASLSDYDMEYIRERLDYYNKLSERYTMPDEAVRLADFKLKGRKKVYFFDAFEYTRYFPLDFKICTLFGDIIHVPDFPSIVKSRPIEGENSNSVVMKLEKIRHFLFVNDGKSFKEKKDMLVFRGKVRQEHRIRFMEMYYNKSERLDTGQVNISAGAKYPAERLTIAEHLNYKYILSLEGNDVASNLKWVMSSNSLAVMPRPKYETWFMEGKLIPNHHYVLIKDDYSDLEERMDYYSSHLGEAQEIIENAHRYIDRFRDNNCEDLLNLLVLKKYFEYTGQALP